MMATYLIKFSQYIILRKTWKIHKRSKRSAVDVAYKLYGPSVAESRQHILVLHGFLGSKRNWDGMCTKISAATNTCVIAADARNHGDSPHADSHSYQELASDAAKLLTKLAIKKAHFIGHSMGGRTAMTLALSEPSKVASLIVADISPLTAINLESSMFPALLRIMKTVNFQKATSLSEARTAARETILASGLIDNVHAMAFFIMSIGQRDKAYGWKYNLEVLARDFGLIATFPSELMSSQYPGPTLFVAGGQSDYVPKTDEPGIRKLFPDLELKYIDHVGHNVHAEDPTAFFNIVQPFLLKVLK